MPNENSGKEAGNPATVLNEIVHPIAGTLNLRDIAIEKRMTGSFLERGGLESSLKQELTQNDLGGKKDEQTSSVSAGYTRRKR